MLDRIYNSVMSENIGGETIGGFGTKTTWVPETIHKGEESPVISCIGGGGFQPSRMMLVLCCYGEFCLCYEEISSRKIQNFIVLPHDVQTELKKGCHKPHPQQSRNIH